MNVKKSPSSPPSRSHHLLGSSSSDKHRSYNPYTAASGASLSYTYPVKQGQGSRERSLSPEARPHSYYNKKTGRADGTGHVTPLGSLSRSFSGDGVHGGREGGEGVVNQAQNSEADDRVADRDRSTKEAAQAAAEAEEVIYSLQQKMQQLTSSEEHLRALNQDIGHQITFLHKEVKRRDETARIREEAIVAVRRENEHLASKIESMHAMLAEKDEQLQRTLVLQEHLAATKKVVRDMAMQLATARYNMANMDAHTTDASKASTYGDGTGNDTYGDDSGSQRSYGSVIGVQDKGKRYNKGYTEDADYLSQERGWEEVGEEEKGLEGYEADPQLESIQMESQRENRDDVYRQRERRASNLVALLQAAYVTDNQS